MADAEAAGQRTESRGPCSVAQPLFLHEGKLLGSGQQMGEVELTGTGVKCARAYRNV